MSVPERAKDDFSTEGKPPVRGLDALVLTASIGENSPEMRARVCAHAKWLGIRLDETANRAGGPRISTEDTRVSAWVIPTDEERMIGAHACRRDAMRPSIAGQRSTAAPGAALFLAAALLLSLAVVATEAQELVRFVGAVQWVAGTRMQVMTDSGTSVAIDLMQADQSSYQGLRGGDVVVVDGVLSPDRRRIVARELWRDSGRGFWTQSP